jgi:glyoxylate carboligase
MQGKTAIANILKQEGVDAAFCFPNNALIDAAAAAGIRPIISRMERTAVNMADGYSRVTNGHNNGVCMVQAGPGIENAFSGVARPMRPPPLSLCCPATRVPSGLACPPTSAPAETMLELPSGPTWSTGLTGSQR